MKVSWGRVERRATKAKLHGLGGSPAGGEANGIRLMTQEFAYCEKVVL